MINIKYKLIIILLIFFISILYSIPNFYGESPAIIIKNLENNTNILIDIEKNLGISKTKYKINKTKNNEIIIKFFSTEDQLTTFEILKTKYNDISLNIVNNLNNNFFKKINSNPMKFGLDLRGGVNLLINIDTKKPIKIFLKSEIQNLKDKINKENIKIKDINITKKNVIEISFLSKIDLDKFNNKLKDNNNFKIIFQKNLIIQIKLNKNLINDIKLQTIYKTKNILEKRINELGIADCIIQTKGKKNIIIEIPGIQEISRAKNILGKIATINFMLVDEKHNIQEALKGKKIKNAKLFYTQNKQPILLQNNILLSGESIIYATSGFDQLKNKPCVNIKIGKKNVKQFENITKKNIGKKMAIVYRESKLDKNNTTTYDDKIISVATIMSSLSNDFQITGLDLQESKDLALLLRTGSLPTSISIIEEKIIGPNLGEKNITNGVLSIFISFILILLFMIIRYKNYGLIAGFGLIVNIISLISIMSIIGTTLTLPGISGIALTIAMSIDANILIFERIKEEIKNEKNIYYATEKGFNNALKSIIDSNITTLIIGIILFTFSYGPTKGFGITLSIGILTSIYSSIIVTQTIINYYLITKLKYKKNDKLY